jgi:hypothetical protein
MQEKRLIEPSKTCIKQANLLCQKKLIETKSKTIEQSRLIKLIP